MGLLDNYGKGPHNLGMTPRPNFEHQLLISKIIRNLSRLDKKKQSFDNARNKSYR